VFVLEGSSQHRQARKSPFRSTPCENVRDLLGGATIAGSWDIKPGWADAAVAICRSIAAGGAVVTHQLLQAILGIATVAGSVGGAKPPIGHRPQSWAWPSTRRPQLVGDTTAAGGVRR
jgi:hypothetical protein